MFVPLLFRSLHRRNHVGRASEAEDGARAADTATSAAKSVIEALPGSKIAVVDTGVTDAPAGLGLILAGQALTSGRTLDEAALLVDAYSQHVKMNFTMAQLDYAVAGGRATPVRAFLANLLGFRPVVGFVNGEVEVVAKMRAGSSQVTALLAALAKELEPGARIWASVFHGGVPDESAELVLALSEQYDVEFAYERALSASIYLHAGHGSLGVCAVPMAQLPFEPPVPTELDQRA